MRLLSACFVHLHVFYLHPLGEEQFEKLAAIANLSKLLLFAIALP
jgi:hypothetical protein